MDWYSQVKREFSRALALTALPVVWLPALLVYGGLNVVVGLFTYDTVNKMLASGDPQAQADGMVLISLIAIFATPAVASGMWAVSREAVVRGRARWRDFWSGMGTYYWRLVGLALLAGLTVSVIGMVLAGPYARRGVGIGQRPWDFPVPFFLAYLVAEYFVNPIVPAMVIEQKRAIESIGLGIRFAVRNASILVPVAVVDLAIARILHRVEVAVVEPFTEGYYFGPERLTALGVSYVVFALISALVSAFFRVLYLGIYHSRRPAGAESAEQSGPPEAGGVPGLVRPEESAPPGEAGLPEEDEPSQGDVPTEAGPPQDPQGLG